MYVAARRLPAEVGIVDRYAAAIVRDGGLEPVEPGVALPARTLGAVEEPGRAAGVAAVRVRLVQQRPCRARWGPSRLDAAIARRRVLRVQLPRLRVEDRGGLRVEQYVRR